MNKEKYRQKNDNDRNIAKEEKFQINDYWDMLKWPLVILPILTFSPLVVWSVYVSSSPAHKKEIRLYEEKLKKCGTKEKTEIKSLSRRIECDDIGKFVFYKKIKGEKNAFKPEVIWADEAIVHFKDDVKVPMLVENYKPSLDRGNGKCIKLPPPEKEWFKRYEFILPKDYKIKEDFDGDIK